MTNPRLLYSQQANIARKLEASCTTSVAINNKPSSGISSKQPLCTQEGLPVLKSPINFLCRKLLHTYLFEFGDCFVAVNGKEAVQTVKCALNGRILFMFSPRIYLGVISV